MHELDRGIVLLPFILGDPGYPLLTFDCSLSHSYWHFTVLVWAMYFSDVF